MIVYGNTTCGIYCRKQVGMYYITQILSDVNFLDGKSQSTVLYAFVSFRYDEELVIPIVENENEELEIKVKYM